MTQLNNAIFFLHPFTKVKPLLLVLLAVSTLTACSKTVEKTTTADNYQQSASLLLLTPEKSYTVTREYLGQIIAKQHTNLSFEYTGRVNQILVDTGDVIEKGQLLAQQDTQLLRFKTTELQSQKEQAQAQIMLNKVNLDRIKTLINDGYSSLQRLDELNSENKILNAQINGLNARIDTIEYQKKKSSLIAPFNGVITERFISNGEITPASQASFRFMEHANNEINVGVPSKMASSLVLGQKFTIQIDDIPPKNLIKQATLIAIGQQINSVNRTIQLRLKMPKTLDKSNSYNGQLVRVTIEQEINKPGFWIPLNAITDGVRGQWQVLMANSTNSADNHSYQLQSATVNILHTNEHSAYVNGLSLEPHQIIAQGVHRYVSGQLVKELTQTLANTAGNKE